MRKRTSLLGGRRAGCGRHVRHREGTVRLDVPVPAPVAAALRSLHGKRLLDHLEGVLRAAHPDLRHLWPLPFPDRIKPEGAG